MREVQDYVEIVTMIKSPTHEKYYFFNKLYYLSARCQILYSVLKKEG